MHVYLNSPNSYLFKIKVHYLNIITTCRNELKQVHLTSTHPSCGFCTRISNRTFSLIKTGEKGANKSSQTLLSNLKWPCGLDKILMSLVSPTLTHWMACYATLAANCKWHFGKCFPWNDSLISFKCLADCLCNPYWALKWKSLSNWQLLSGLIEIYLCLLSV